MYVGRSYKLSEFIIWTRKSIYALFFMGVLAVMLYEVIGFKWLGISWTVVGLLGTATAFIVGFKNTQTYNRTIEAQHIWTGILNTSRTWGLLSRDFLNDPEMTKLLLYRHFAWLTALRYEMREYRVWESTQKKHNAEYQKFYVVPENEFLLENELSKYLPDIELKAILNKKNKAASILSQQSLALKEGFDNQVIAVLHYLELERTLKELLALQGRSEQLKNSPYPRQYAIINTLLVRLFCFLLPFGMLKEFDKLNDAVEGIMKGNMVWLAVPFSVIISWMYVSLEQVGESTENPFEGSPNDVPISQISADIEADLREMIGEQVAMHRSIHEHDIIM